MRDAFINALNTQKITSEWVTSLSENLVNVYTPGYREKKFTFKTFLNGSIAEDRLRNLGQGKSSPGTSDENIYLEGKGYFVLRNDKGRIVYTRLGDFKFDGEGVYRSSDGQAVQGYILNDKGEIMNGAKPVDAESFVDTAFDGGAASVPTTNVKLWIDPSNGKYLGKYEEFEFADDGYRFYEYIDKNILNSKKINREFNCEHLITKKINGKTAYVYPFEYFRKLLIERYKINDFM